MNLNTFILPRLLKGSLKAPQKTPKSAKPEEMDESEKRDSLIASIIMTPGSSKKAKKSKKSEKKDQEELSLNESSSKKKSKKDKKAEEFENTIFPSTFPEASIKEAQELLLNSISKKKSKKKKKDKVEENGGMVEDEPNEIAIPLPNSDSGSRSPVR